MKPFLYTSLCCFILGLFSACQQKPVKFSQEALNEKIEWLSKKVDEQNVSLQKIREDFFQLDRKYDRLKKAQKEVRVLETTKLRPNPFLEDEALSSELEEFSASKGQTVASTKNKEIVHLLFRAKEYMSEKSYEKAIESLQKFTSEISDVILLEEGMDLLSEAYYLNRDYSFAVLACNDFESKFGKSIRMSKILYRKATAMQLSGNQKGYLTMLKEIVKRYPQSEESKIASQSLSAKSPMNSKNDGSTNPGEKDPFIF